MNKVKNLRESAIWRAFLHMGLIRGSYIGRNMCVVAALRTFVLVASSVVVAPGVLASRTRLASTRGIALGHLTYC